MQFGMSVHVQIVYTHTVHLCVCVFMLTFVAINVYLSSQLQEESTDDGSSSPRHYAPSPPPVSRIASTSTPPLTPQSSKKIFMETLLMPTPNTIDSVFDEEKALELFASNHKDIQISVSDCVGIVCIAPLFLLCLFVSVSLLSYNACRQDHSGILSRHL